VAESLLLTTGARLQAAHHLDLWAPSPEDPVYVQRAREQEAMLIEKWLNEYWAKL
jgi:hypothetical protein